jgi:hypothetical protein
VPVQFRLEEESMMGRKGNNPNWQDRLLGGAILACFAVIAVVALLFAVAHWGDGQWRANHAPAIHASGPRTINE